MSDAARLLFEKISRFDRPCEPVSVSVPFAQGVLADPDQLSVLDTGVALPLQRRVLARWPDSSIKWLLLDLQPNLPGNAAHELQLVLNTTASHSMQPEQAVTLEQDADGLAIHTGPLSFRIPHSGFLPISDIRLNGHVCWQQPVFNGITIKIGGRELSSLQAPVELSIAEAGPLRVVVEVRGKHTGVDGHAFLELRGRITAYAGKPYVEIEYGFFHTEPEGSLALEAIQLAAQLPPTGTARLALGEGYYQTRVKESQEALDLKLTAETILFQSNEHYVDSFYGDFWADWRDGQAGLAISHYQAHQHFPKQLQATREGIVAGIFPDGEAPLTIAQGAGKTHRLLVHIHDGSLPLSEVSSRSLQFQLPDRPALPAAWYRTNNPWELDLFPEHIPGQIMTRVTELHDGRPRALGLLHFGDAPDAGYTDQGRGNGSTVWVNNEYDHPHACALFYALTGMRRALDSSLVAARHWLDVDLCHYSDDPLRHGGLVIHSAHHVSGHVIPSHQWVEGFLDYYYLTGRREGLEAATSVAENLLRHLELPHMNDPAAAQTREGGWALRAMSAMYRATAEARYKAAADRLVNIFLEWRERYGGLLAPYTSHSMPRVPFMISLTLNSLAHYLLIEDNPQVKALIVESIDDVLEHCLGPDGILYYKELPSLRRPHPTVHSFEALTHAYHVSGNQHYLRVALRQFAAYYERGVQRLWVGGKRTDEDGAVIEGHGGGRNFADSYISITLFAAAATRAGLLEMYEYPA